MGLLDEVLGGMAAGATGRGGAPKESGSMAGIAATLIPVVLAMLSQRSAEPRAGLSGGGVGDVLGGLLGSGAGAGAGGLGQILELFQRAGFGAQASSWVGTGANLPISPEAIAQVFGGGSLGQIAARAGLSEHETSAGLAHILPGIVDRLTPEGRIPAADSLESALGAFSQRLGG